MTSPTHFTHVPINRGRQVLITGGAHAGKSGVVLADHGSAVLVFIQLSTGPIRPLIHKDRVKVVGL